MSQYVRANKLKQAMLLYFSFLTLRKRENLLNLNVIYEKNLIFLLKAMFYYYLVIYKNILSEFQLYKFFSQSGLFEFQIPGTG